MGALTPTHLVLILIIALIVVGPGRLPEVGSAIGKSIKEFKKASSDIVLGSASQPAPSAQQYQPAQPAQPVAYQPVQPVAYQPPASFVAQPGQAAYPAPTQYYQPQPDPAAGFVAQPGQAAYPAPAQYYQPQPASGAPAQDGYQPVSGVVVEPPSGPVPG
jgi:sec-independent protein translocase protein TatA